MVFGDLQFFDIIIFAVIAVFIIYRLRSVLGKRTGFQKNVNQQEFVEKKLKPQQENTPQLKESEKKLEIVYRKVSSFDHKVFLEGAKKAFEIIITAFNKGDKTTLKGLVSKDVYSAFESAIDSGSNNPKSQFYSLVIDSIQDAKVENGNIIIAVNFISEQILGDNEESAIKNKDTWTFTKAETSTNPAWTLVST
ncbi:Tim44/TimA family putative adaptor protein [Pelagibacterales bacterium SAG-MED31]|nr:Tim44/TimA family putative adaptor protein [Pelagibacterales bacterium SAG-MED31]